MNSRIIIENRSRWSDEKALSYVSSVINKGRISNYGKQYCYYCVFGDPDGGIETTVASFLNKKSDRFVVSDSVQTRLNSEETK